MLSYPCGHAPSDGMSWLRHSRVCIAAWLCWATGWESARARTHAATAAMAGAGRAPRPGGLSAWAGFAQRDPRAIGWETKEVFELRFGCMMQPRGSSRWGLQGGEDGLAYAPLTKYPWQQPWGLLFESMTIFMCAARRQAWQGP